MTNKEFLELVDLLQDETDIASRLKDIPERATKNNPSGEYAKVERWLRWYITPHDELDIIN